MQEVVEYCQVLKDKYFALCDVVFGTLQPEATKEGEKNGENAGEKGSAKNEEKWWD